jgi:hypothetical protein
MYEQNAPFDAPTNMTEEVGPATILCLQFQTLLALPFTFSNLGIEVFTHRLTGRWQRWSWSHDNDINSSNKMMHEQ